MATKGQKYKKWAAEEKYKIIKPALDMQKSTVQITKETGINNGLITTWIHKYRKYDMEGLISKKKPSYGYHRIWKRIFEKTGWYVLM